MCYRLQSWTGTNRKVPLSRKMLMNDAVSPILELLLNSWKLIAILRIRLNAKEMSKYCVQVQPTSTCFVESLSFEV